MAIVAAREGGAAATAEVGLAVAEEAAVAEAAEEVDGDHYSVWRSRCVYDDSQKARLTTAFLRISTPTQLCSSTCTTHSHLGDQLGHRAFCLVQSKHVRFLHDALDLLLIL